MLIERFYKVTPDGIRLDEAKFYKEVIKPYVR